MGFDEIIDGPKIIDTRSVFDIRAGWILMTFAEPHKSFMSPWIIVKHRNLNDPRLKRGNRFGGRLLNTF